MNPNITEKPNQNLTIKKLTRGAYNTINAKNCIFKTTKLHRKDQEEIKDRIHEILIFRITF